MRHCRALVVLAILSGISGCSLDTTTAKHPPSWVPGNEIGNMKVQSMLEFPFCESALVANSGANTISVIDTATNAVSHTIGVGSHPNWIAVTSDGALALVTNNLSNDVSLVDLVHNTLAGTVSVGSAPGGISITQDDRFAFVANSTDDTVSVIDLDTNQVTANITVGDAPSLLGISPVNSPNGEQVFVPNQDSNNLTVINVSDHQVVTSIPLGIDPTNVAFTPDGALALVTNVNSHNVSVIDTSTYQVIQTVGVGTRPFGLDIVGMPTGNRAYVANFDSGTVSVIDLNSFTVTTILVGAQPFGVSGNADGSAVYVSRFGSDVVSVIDTATNTVTGTVPVGDGPLGVTVGVCPPLEVPIDIKPGSSPNSINRKSHGNVPVALLSTPTFDATGVDVTTVRFAGAAARTPSNSQEDVNGDGLMDQVFHFRTNDLSLLDNATEATLIGKTLDGRKVIGRDSVRLVK